MVSQHKLDKFYLGVCSLASELSYCKRAQVGAIIVRDNRIISYGFNGTLPGQENCCEEKLSNGEFKTKPNVVHAEINAIYKIESYNDCTGATMYCSLQPCFACSAAIVNSGIAEVVYTNKYGKNDGIELLTNNNVKVRYVAYEY